MKNSSAIGRKDLSSTSEPTVMFWGPARRCYASFVVSNQCIVKDQLGVGNICTDMQPTTSLMWLSRTINAVIVAMTPQLGLDHSRQDWQSVMSAGA